jgi:hypothetical protein
MQIFLMMAFTSSDEKGCFLDYFVPSSFASGYGGHA